MVCRRRRALLLLCCFAGGRLHARASQVAAVRNLDVRRAVQRVANELIRYSLFAVLYPIGIGSEWWLMYRAARVTESPVVAGVFYFCLALYAPGMLVGFFLLRCG